MLTIMDYTERAQSRYTLEFLVHNSRKQQNFTYIIVARVQPRTSKGITELF